MVKNKKEVIKRKDRLNDEMSAEEKEKFWQEMYSYAKEKLGNSDEIARKRADIWTEAICEKWFIGEDKKHTTEKEEKMIRNLVLLFGLPEEKARKWFKDLDEELRKKAERKWKIGKNPNRWMVYDLYQITYQGERDSGNNDETARKIAFNVTEAARKAWIWYAKHHK